MKPQINYFLPYQKASQLFLLKSLNSHLKVGAYSFALFSTSNNEVLDWIKDAGFINVENGDYYHTGRLAPEGQGSVYLNYSITLK
jgi:hypothetical protein